MQDQKVKIEEVSKFWSENPCDANGSTSANRKQYFEEIEKHRYALIRHIPHVAKFNQFKNKKVLEIGCGIGTDGRQFAKNGADYYGINIDEGSTTLTLEAFQLFGLKGDIRQMNGEALEFENNFFDHIYCCGVIHHSPDTEKIVEEMYRVLKPGGTVCVMIYNKSSVNYYFEIMFLRKIFRFFLIPSFTPHFISKVTGFNEHKLKRHREILFSQKMTKDKWISINTDGPNCPLAKVYNKREAYLLFEAAGFSQIKTYVRFFNKTHYSYLGKLIPNWLEDQIGNRWGWSRWIEAVKPS